MLTGLWNRSKDSPIITYSGLDCQLLEIFRDILIYPPKKSSKANFQPGR